MVFPPNLKGVSLSLPARVFARRVVGGAVGVGVWKFPGGLTGGTMQNVLLGFDSQITMPGVTIDAQITIT